MALEGDNPYAWVVMPQYGHNLDSIFESTDRNFSRETIYDVGVAILNSLEITHNAGYVYNDLKLDNLMVGYNQYLNLTN